MIITTYLATPFICLTKQGGKMMKTAFVPKKNDIGKTVETRVKNTNEYDRLSKMAKFYPMGIKTFLVKQDN